MTSNRREWRGLRYYERQAERTDMARTILIVGILVLVSIAIAQLFYWAVSLI